MASGTESKNSASVILADLLRHWAGFGVNKYVISFLFWVRLLAMEHFPAKQRF